MESLGRQRAGGEGESRWAPDLWVSPGVCRPFCEPLRLLGGKLKELMAPRTGHHWAAAAGRQGGSGQSGIFRALSGLWLFHCVRAGLDFPACAWDRAGPPSGVSG